ncbi:MAG: glycosyltransferase family 4 protein [Alphaproteobacteria bacterium]|nr:glycosyltransferase family 4 protein [Alphaproteobacteria bacterium]
MQYLTPGLAFLFSLAATLLLTGILVRALRQRQIFDLPNERSSHENPTPRGGGIAVIAVVLAAAALIALLSKPAPAGLWPVLAGAGLLAGISWLDDLKGMSALPRLAAQGAAVALGLAFVPSESLVFQGLLPELADRLLAGLLWIWFVNLFNFMDGIDGIAGVEAACIGAGLFVVLQGLGGYAELGLVALATAGAALGFLWWNWQPARIFLGDVGSVPLGYLLGWLLLSAAAAGAWAPALILPLYYIADASLTLVRRLLRGERIWAAHRQHAYQRAVQAGMSHAQTVCVIAVGNVALIGLAVVAASGWPIAALGVSGFVVLLVLFALHRAPGKGT